MRGDLTEKCVSEMASLAGNDKIWRVMKTSTNVISNGVTQNKTCASGSQIPLHRLLQKCHKVLCSSAGSQCIGGKHFLRMLVEQQRPAGAGTLHSREQSWVGKWLNGMRRAEQGRDGVESGQTGSGRRWVRRGRACWNPTLFPGSIYMHQSMQTCTGDIANSGGVKAYLRRPPAKSAMEEIF